MFTAIAGSYDLNNRLHSLGLDQYWRRQVVQLSEVTPNDHIVDVACGTGDLTLQFVEALKTTPNAALGQVVGLDFTYAMLPFARQKASGKAAGMTPLWLNGDALALPLPDACCDIVSIAFGIRNVQNVAAALAEFRRILRPGGRLMILEFSEPEHRIIRWLNHIYCHRIMPLTATWISRDKSGAYRYLPKSIETFIPREGMKQLMASAGFTDIRLTPMTFGVCVCYRGLR